MRCIRRSALPSLAALLAVTWSMGAAALRADGPSVKPAPLPPALDKVAPENIAELRAIEKHVQEVLKKITPCVVGVRVGAGQGSGVIVSEDGLVLTAGHVSGQPGRNCVVILPNGKTLKAKTLGRNSGIDSGMVKITQEGKYPFIELGNSAALKRGQWVLALGHPGGFRPNRTPVVRLGRVLFNNRALVRTDCTLVGGDSGGPLFDMNGKVVGIHSRIGGSSITENIHVPVDTYRATWDRLAKGDSWGGRLGSSVLVQSAGGKLVFEKEGQLSEKNKKDSLQSGCFRKSYKFAMKAGSTYTIDLVSKKIDSYLRLEDAAGKNLAEDDDGGGTLNSRIVHRAVRDGTYRIVVTTCDPGQTGPYRLTVHEADVKEAFVQGKIDVLRTVRVPRLVVQTVLDKLAQAGLPMHVNAVLIDGAGNPVAGKEVTIRWDNGTQKLKADAEGVVRWKLSKDRLRQLSLELPAGTRALLGLTDADGRPMPRLLKDDATRATVKSAGGKVVMQSKGHLAESDPKDRVKNECVHKVHEFKLAAGKTYTFDLESEDFDAFLRLDNGSGKELAQDDDGAGFLNSRVVFRSTRDESIRVVVTTCDPGQSGAYRLTIRETDSAPNAPKQPANK